MNELKKEFLKETAKTILGKEKEFTIALCAFLANGHILIEDVPGVGKTTFAKTLAKVLGLTFSRIQFTSDLMPSDIVGSQIYNPKEHNFSTFKGPLFNQFILADELNRANPKTQSSMLEAMEERQVTIDKESYLLPIPFFVVATQNPNTQIGTHLLPESQLDRFIVSLKLNYPTREDEKNLILSKNGQHKLNTVNIVFSADQIAKIKNDLESVKLSDKIVNYILDLLTVSRTNNLFAPLSPRAGIDMVKMAKAYAFINGRDFVLPDDVQVILPYVVNHRSTLSNSSELIKYVSVD